MANVWLGRLHSRPEFQRLFAIKTVLAGEADNPLFRAMFLDEARLVSRIDHPNVVRVNDVGEHAGLPYLVMELIEGDSLDKLVHDLRRAGEIIPLGIALRIATDACNGLGAAHELVDSTGAPMNVVHRDVSPQNILVTTTGLSKVIDFGIAKGRDRVSAKTSTGVLKGKTSYMPREQACGEEVDARTDTWALGAVLYYLFAGHPPYKTNSELATLRMAITGAPIEPLPPSVPAPVRALVAKALEHDPHARFQTARDMAVALESAIRQLGAAASYNDVAAFVRKTMAARLATRRELVAQALAESTTRESQRLSAAVPIEVDVNVEEMETPGGTVWGAALRSIASGVPRDARPSRARFALTALAALCVAVLGLVGMMGRGHHTAAAGGGSEARLALTGAGRNEPLSSVVQLDEPVAVTLPEPAPLPAAPSAATATASATAQRVRPAAPPRAAGSAAAASPTATKTVTRPVSKSRDDEAGF
jgi:serine/threonine-protein kinase